MPVFREGEGQAPAWSELAMFEILNVKPRQACEIPFRGPEERYVCYEGELDLQIDDNITPLKKGDVLDIPAKKTVLLSSEDGGSAVRLCGTWGEETGSTGVFSPSISDEPGNPGDPVEYERNTRFDNHYHDCDEYWIICSGRGVAASEGRLYEVGPGDCVATGAGYHHDFPMVHEDVMGVYFETTLEGEKRFGHLWDHKHGPANPDPAKI